ncbi:MAG: hypothetical protein HC773_05220 [Scytonema sp. CRU_2_7]|nr:hypothetical protein [Scytonema sp. CRU_2_7]
MKDAIYDWVFGVTGMNTVWQFQNMPVPNKPYIALRISSFIQIGDSQKTPSAVQTLANEHDVITNWDFVLELLGFGPGVVQATVNLKSSLNDDTIHQALKAGGVISWNDTNPVLDISGVDDNNNEERSSFDSNMRTSDIITGIPQGMIQIVNIDGTYENPGMSDILTTLNIDSTI